MRKVTREVVLAFMDGRPKRIDNTETDGVSLRLHGNTIAEWRPDGLWITDAGWPTRTTHDRLNGVFHAAGSASFVRTNRGSQWLYVPAENGDCGPWNGCWTHIPCDHERSIQHLTLIASKQKEVA